MNYKNVKIIFMGTAEFGIPTLNILNDIFNLHTIITHPYYHSHDQKNT